MEQFTDRRRFLAGGAAALAALPIAGLPLAGLPLAGFIGPALAQAEPGASAWSPASQSRMRLIGGGLAADGAAYRAGVEIKLSQGYKTYWRSPGDSGVPPMFNWGRSRNLAGVNVVWPTPIRFQDGAGFSIGYAGEVVFPLLVTAADASLPVELALDLDYAVCDKLCIPAQGAAALILPRERTRHIARIAAFEAKAPRRVGLAEAHQGLSLVAAGVAQPGAKPMLTLAIATPDGVRPDDVFAECPGMWSFRAPEFTRAADGSWSAALAVLDRPATNGPVDLLVTICAGSTAIETLLALDFGQA